MNSKNKIRLIFCFLLMVFGFNSVSLATHLRAGEITAKRVSNTQFTYKITLITYTDQIGGRTANDGQNDVNFYFGFSTNKVETFKVTRKKKNNINNSTVCNVYDTTFTFPAAGRYTISCGIVNRNEKTINLPQPSDKISFFVSTTIQISQSFGLNSTPVLLNIPLDTAALGKKFIHNPGAYDIDGDSLSYKLSTPQKDKGVDTGVGEFIDAYSDPATIGKAPVLNQAGNGPAVFRIDPITGDLLWDSPREIGQYNIAFIVEEWRKAPDGSSIKIGEIVRDMQIIVVESGNNSPSLEVPADVCIEAGKKASFDVKATDKDDQVLKITASGGVFNKDASGLPIVFVVPEAATFSSVSGRKLATGTFSWNTNCQHARTQGYDVLFKVEDSPGRFETQLVDIKTVKVKVLPPRAVGIKAQETSAGIEVTWQLLSSCKNAGKMLVYRKNGCSGLLADICKSGMPSEWGYNLVGTVSVADTLFLDKTGEKGANYSYRVVTEIQENAQLTLQSAPSVEICIGADVKTGSNLLTKVSIKSTDKNTGEIEVRWTKPLGFIKEENKGPFEYRLFRALGLGSENYEQIFIQKTELTNSNDTSYTDSKLNTADNYYKYKVEFYTEGNKKFSSSSVASNVRLNGSPTNKAIKLNWQASVPWNNDNQTHAIYRENKNKPGEFSLIKKLNVSNASTYNFTDDGKDEEKADGDLSTSLENGQRYCYFVLTLGKYDQAPQYGLLENASQIFCLAPEDNTPPCEATFTNTDVNNSLIQCKDFKPEDYCKESTFANKLVWANPSTNGCPQTIKSYNIYYSRYQDENPRLIGSSTAPTYTHRKNSQEGFAGCYIVTALNNFNLESKPSLRVCYDNCDNIGFPNVFSPNEDGKNDTFTPLNCPAFVKAVSYTIYASNGLKVAEYTGTELNWDGKDSGGRALPSGVYYYTVNVTFEKLAREGLTKTFKGYVSILK
jgi:gliding motility-associated-like protein